MNDIAPALVPVAATAPELEMRRDFTPGRIDAVLQHPEVARWVFPHPGPQGPLSFAALLRDLRNVVLMSDTGGAVFLWLDDTCYELHTQFLPESRGRPTVRFMHKALAYMFTHTNCMEVVTKVPTHNTAACALARHFHFTLDATVPSSWQLTDEVASDVEFYGYRWHDWLRHSPLVGAQGEAFHKQFERERVRLGVSEAGHGDDPWHNRVVGATLATAYAGLLDKAAILYNRWAKFAGYDIMAIRSSLPPVIEFSSGLRLVLDAARGEFEVVPPPATATPKAGV